MVFCLVGRSGSGKTTVAKELSKDYNVIQSYTTRPPRYENEWGHTFVESYPHEHVPKTIAYNEFNGYEYWATEDQVKGKSIYIIDPAGDELLRALNKYQVVTIYFTLDPMIAYDRMVGERGDEKALARAKHDHKLFRVVKTDWVVDADMRIDEVVKSVKEIIDIY